MSFFLKCLPVGPLQENCYLIADKANKQAVLIDPGDEAERLLDELETNGFMLVALWLTHAHFDHIGAVQSIKDVHDVPIYLHPEDLLLYEHAKQAADLWGIPFRQPTAKTLDLSENQILQLGEHEFRCLFTPGHAPGHIAFYADKLNLVIAGDALFQGSIGRTDLPMGNHDQLIRSIKTKLLSLPDDTVVYPGHGSATQIGLEKQHNPFLV